MESAVGSGLRSPAARTTNALDTFRPGRGDGAHQLTLHAKTYNMPLPPSLNPQGTAGVDGENKLQVILDPDQGQQMVIKLLEQQLAILSDLWKSANERASASEVPNQSIDFAPRYFTTAGRDLHRAVAWYAQLKKEKL